MLKELDKKLIQKEMERFGRKEKLKLIIDTSCPVSSIEELFNKYESFEITEHWYDSEPNECNFCNINKPNCNCAECSIWKKWDKSEKQLSFNNWIDVAGPGIWGIDQKKSDKYTKDILEEILKDKEYTERLFFYIPKSNQAKDYFNLFYYNRDRDNRDIWIVMKKK